MEEQAKKSFIINVVFTSLWILIGVFAGKFLLQYMLPFAVSLLIAWVMQAPAEKICRKIKLKKGTVAAFLSAGVYIAVAALLIFCILKLAGAMGDLISSATNLTQSITDCISAVQNGLSGVLDKISPNVRRTGEKFIASFSASVTKKISDFLSNLAAVTVKRAPSFLFSALAALAASCYIAKDFDGLVKFCKGLMSEKTAIKLAKIKNIFKTCILKMLGSYGIIFALTLGEITVGLMILGVENAVLIGALISLVDILPVLGAGAVLIPWGIISIISGSTARGVGIIILYLAVLIVRNFAEPKIVADKTGINPLFMLLAMFLGLRVFGFWGLIILPVTLVVTVKYYKSEMETS